MSDTTDSSINSTSTAAAPVATGPTSAAPIVAGDAQSASAPVDPASDSTAAVTASNPGQTASAADTTATPLGSEAATSEPKSDAGTETADETETASDPVDETPTVGAYEKLLQVAASVERAKFALGLKGFFDPAQTVINGLVDEVLADVPFTDQSQPIWYRESDETTVERAAKAGYEAFHAANGVSDASLVAWDSVSEDVKNCYRAAAKAALAIKK
jgi:hypothetical protein